MSAGRIGWIDTARGYGMILVFYGHVVGPVARQFAAGADQFRLIYSFHMPFFFLLAGYVSSPPSSNRFEYVWSRLRTRMIPALFFCALGALGYVANAAVLGGIPWLPGSDQFRPLLRGVPAMNHMAWFLYCMFSVDILHLLLHRTEGKPRTEVPALVGLLAVGWYLGLKHRRILDLLGWHDIPLYAIEAIVAYALFRTGRLLRRLDWPRASDTPRTSVVLALVCAAGVLATFDLNRGPFVWRNMGVIMSAMSHGHLAWFALTALLGSLFVCHLAQATSDREWLQYLGRNSLALLGLNGLYFEYVSNPLGELVAPHLSDSHLGVLAWALPTTALQMLLCVPVIRVLRARVPWAVGVR